MRIGLVQMNPTVGDLEGNHELARGALEEARRLAVDLLLFPELCLTGYPPEDLLSNQGFLRATRASLERLIPETRGLLAVLGLPLQQGDELHNAAALLDNGRWVDTYSKVTLPNYGVFDEKRHFRPGLRCPVYRWGDLILGVNVCEDIWAADGIPLRQARGGARLLVNLSASPYHAGKGQERELLLRHRARSLGAAIAYVNLVGGQDELLFDGESLLVDASGRVRARAPQFEPSLLVADITPEWFEGAVGSDPGYTEPEAESIDELASQIYLDHVALPEPAPRTDRPPLEAALGGVAKRLEGEAEVYAALRLGLGDYVRKNGFREVVLGVSGGIDSALTAVLAADALGPAQVLCVSMPTRWNSEETRQGARDLAARLGAPFLEIPIEGVLASFKEALDPRFSGRPQDVTEENLQARARAVILMALSNKEGRLLLATGNKSELATGYCTLYGDMAGGFAPLKDVPKTLVYRLARHRNGAAGPIPDDTLERPPSAELKPGQTDQDTLPPYELLDEILEAKVEREEDADLLVARGLDPRWVEAVYRWIDQNEYKRRQAAPGVKITPRAFGRDRRYPITNRYRWSRP